MATFYLQHSGKGKAQYDRQGVVNHVRYVLRKSANIHVESRHLPTKYEQLLGWAGQLYDKVRKNARVVDSLIVNLPRELSHPEHIQLLRTYLNKLTQGRVPYLFVIHGDKPDNPHAHIIISDRDIETGKRSIGLSKAGSSYKLRAMWETTNNEALASHGVAISRYGQHSTHHHDLNAALQPDAPESTLAPEPVSDNVPSIQEAPMEYARERDDTIPALAHHVLDTIIELRRAKVALDTRKQAETRITVLNKLLHETNKKVDRLNSDIASTIQQHDMAHSDVATKARNVGLLSHIGKLVGYRSRSVKVLDQAKRHADSVAKSLQQQEIFLARQQREAKDLNEQMREAERERLTVNKLTEALGTTEQITAAVAMFERQIKRDLDNLPLHELTQAHRDGLIPTHAYTAILNHYENGQGLES